MKDDRLISLNAAIHVIKDALLSWSNMPEWRENKIVGALDKLPSAQPEEPSYDAVKEYCRKRCLSIVDTALLEKYVPSAQRWIPVTKRLPENDDECLTILEDGLYYVQAYSDGEWYYDDVVAWMPLPETYKEHDDD